MNSGRLKPCCGYCSLSHTNACIPASAGDACNGVLYPAGSCLPTCDALDGDKDAYARDAHATNALPMSGLVAQ